jgi:hypothetical protein
MMYQSLALLKFIHLFADLSTLMTQPTTTLICFQLQQLTKLLLSTRAGPAGGWGQSVTCLNETTDSFSVSQEKGKDKLSLRI